MVHFSNKSSSFDRVIPTKHIASCDIAKRADGCIKSALQVIGGLLFLLFFGSGISLFFGKDASFGGGVIGIIFSFVILLVFVWLTNKIKDGWDIVLKSTNGEEIKFTLMDKESSDINQKFVKIIREVICS
jgi:uncharacterized membrane protein